MLKFFSKLLQEKEPAAKEIIQLEEFIEHSLNV